MKNKVILIVFILIGIFSICGNCFADGFYIGQARRKLPDIPNQRAILTYRNGIETLIIESTLDGEKSNYGWIIPVRDQPMKFGKISPGLLKTLSLQLQPKVHHHQTHPKSIDIQVDTLYTILVLIACLIFMRWGLKRSILPLALIALFMIMLPHYLTRHKAYHAEPQSSFIADPLVKIKDREIVGNYEIFVLKALNSSKLNLWLDNNGLSKFPPKATELINDYIAQGWYFAVAKLNTHSDGISTPHPVFLEFKSSRPVYPMRLTALPASSVYLELFVVGEHEAVPIGYNIEKEYCNFFDYGKMAFSNSFSEASDSKLFIPRKAFQRSEEIGHSDASKVMWDGCVVTKLAGTVTSNDMNEDMYFKFRKAVPYQQQLYSSDAKFHKAYYNTLSAACIGGILLTIFYRVLRKRWNKLSITMVWLLLLISCATAFGFTYISLGKATDVYTVQSIDNYNAAEMELYLHLVSKIYKFSTCEELFELLNRYGSENSFTGEPIIPEDSPGNIICEGSGKDIKIKIFRRNGSLTLAGLE